MPQNSQIKRKTISKIVEKGKLVIPKSAYEYIERRRMRREEIMSNPNFIEFDLDVDMDEDGFFHMVEVPVFKSTK